MFTGIVEEIGHIKNISSGRLIISAKKVLSDVNVGDSIAVNGVCLTVTSFKANEFAVDVMPETLRRSSLKSISVGSPVNLERALSLASRLGGHIVSGHIDGTGRIVSITNEQNARVVTIEAPKALLKYIVEKGSVALDGVSLTVVSVTDKDFKVSLIPHTQDVTILHTKRVGDVVNIENDIVGKYIEKFMLAQNDERPSNEQTEKSGLTKEFLLKYGF